MSNITNVQHDDVIGEWFSQQFPEVFRDPPRKTGVMVYCPTGEVSFHYVNEYAGMNYAGELLTEACDKVIPNFPVSVWRVADIVTCGEHKGVSAFMNLKCQHDDQWEFNEFAHELAGNNLLARLRGPIVLVIPNG